MERETSLNPLRARACVCVCVCSLLVCIQLSVYLCESLYVYVRLFGSVSFVFLCVETLSVWILGNVIFFHVCGEGVEVTTTCNIMSKRVQLLSLLLLLLLLLLFLFCFVFYSLVTRVNLLVLILFLWWGGFLYQCGLIKEVT